MSYVIAIPELVQGAAHDLAGIRSSLDAAATVSGPTTAIAAAAQDEVSIAIASAFADFGQEFQVLSAQAHAFHTQFVNLMNASAGAYASAELANTQAVVAAASDSLDPVTRWQQSFNSTTRNAQTVFGAFQQSLNTFSTGFGQLATNPGAFFDNLQTAAQSVFLVGTNPVIASAVVQHTLGGVTQAMNPGATPPDPTVVPINDVHVQVYAGLAGLADFQTGSGVEQGFVTGLTNFAASPASGVLVGALGPLVSPGVALWNSAGAIFADVTGSNPTAALGHLIDTPANVADAFFNGATLNLDALAPTFNPFVTGGTGGGEQLTGLSFAFGGLFSPGQVVDGAGGPMYYGTGGSMLNALGLDLSFFPPDDFAGGNLHIPAIPVGPIGATAGLIDIVGHALSGSL